MMTYLTSSSLREGWNEKGGEFLEASSFLTLEVNGLNSTPCSSGYSKTLEGNSKKFMKAFWELEEDASGK